LDKIGPEYENDKEIGDREVISKKLGNIPYTGSQLSIQNVTLVEEEDEIHITKEL